MFTLIWMLPIGNFQYVPNLIMYFPKLIASPLLANVMGSKPPVRTALFEQHIESGANIVDFHGFELPIWYTSIQEEHLATRSHAGLFDVSHMGFFRFHGSDVLSWLQSIGTQEFMNFASGRCGYTHFLDLDGNIIDDMIFAVNTEDEVFGVPNASMVDTMFEWLSSHLPSDGSVSLEDLSSKTSILALQGPESSQIVSETLGPANSVGRFRCQEIAANDLGITGWIQGTGYTGESGVEIFVTNEHAPKLWSALLEIGSESGIVPVGLGARDTLRLEMGYLLSGQDFLWPGLGETTDSPLPDSFLARDTVETAVPFGLSLNHDFIGRDRLVSSLESEERWHALLCQERGPSARPGHMVLDGPGEDARLIGYVTSGAPAPSLGGTGIAMAYLDGSAVGDEVWIQASRRRRVRAEIVRPPFNSR